MVLVLRVTHMCIILIQNLYHTLKCKYSDCIIAILTLPYLTLFLVTLYYFYAYSLYYLMLGNFDVFYILLGDDPMLYGSIEQNK